MTDCTHPKGFGYYFTIGTECCATCQAPRYPLCEKHANVLHVVGADRSVPCVWCADRDSMNEVIGYALDVVQSHEAKVSLLTGQRGMGYNILTETAGRLGSRVRGLKRALVRAGFMEES